MSEIYDINIGVTQVTSTFIPKGTQVGRRNGAFIPC